MNCGLFCGLKPKKDTLPLPYIIVETRCLVFSKNNKKTFLSEEQKGVKQMTVR